jgi:hemerythrin superfamily protein
MTEKIASSSIEDALSRDHEMIDAVFYRLSASLKDEASDARAPLEELVRRLGYHMQWEEDVLFPAARSVARISQKGIESLVLDHLRIRETLQWLETEIRQNHLDTARVVMDSLRVFLIGHNRDEEHGVYAEADRYLPPERRRQALEAFRPGL